MLTPETMYYAVAALVHTTKSKRQGQLHYRARKPSATLQFPTRAFPYRAHYFDAQTGRFLIYMKLTFLPGRGLPNRSLISMAGKPNLGQGISFAHAELHAN